MTAAAFAGSLICAQGAFAAPTTVGGGAFGVEAHLDALVVPVDAGPLPAVTLPSEGSEPLTASLLDTDVLGLVKLKSGNVKTEGQADPGSADSSVTVADVDVAGLVQAKVASSTCSATTSGATGSAKVLDLVVAGIPIAVLDLGPNTKISLPVGTVIVNEQTLTAPAPAAATKAKARAKAKAKARSQRRARKAPRKLRASQAQGITVNAVHVQLDVLGIVTGDVILGQSRCSVGG